MLPTRLPLQDPVDSPSDSADDQDGNVADTDSDHKSGDEPSSDDESPDTEGKIAGAQTRTKSKQTLKRKHRATSPSRFGAALQTLLNTDVPSNLPLSLQPSVARKRRDEKLEVKAKKVIEVERKEREETNHIKDVIGGWGGESERALRKVAQRGVVKLFNAIQQAQAVAAADVEESKAARGSGKPTLPAPSIDSKRKKGKGKDTPAGPNKMDVIGQHDFLDLIRSGGTVSKK